MSEISASTLADLISQVYRHTGIAMPVRKSVLLQGRLRPRMRALGIDDADYAGYLRVLETDLAEVPVFINMVTTNDTAFFRTPHVWAYFSQMFLPQWFALHPHTKLTIWSAAAASGEEAYSISVLCNEFKERAQGFTYQILATDISTEMVAMGAAGFYTGRSVERLRSSHPEFVRKYFCEKSSGLQASAQIQKNIQFESRNLLKPVLPNIKFDLIFLRNVLIYFDDESQGKVIANVRNAMADGARLILGESESLGKVKTDLLHDAPLVYRIHHGVV